MSKLLISEPPLLVLPSLAQKIGLNEAIIVQQLHYWVNSSGKSMNGRKWTYNTYDDWQEQFPFWSKSTVIRTLSNLEKQGLIMTDNFNKMKSDKTKWYTVNYEALFKLSSPTSQIEQSIYSNWIDGSTQNDQSNTLDFTKTSTETTKIPFVEIIDYLNNVASTSYKSSTKKTQSSIKARWNEGFRLDDFKRVIDIKVNEWGNDPKMSKFIRPDTLFGTKFESYLNQKGGGFVGSNQQYHRKDHPDEFDPDELSL